MPRDRGVVPVRLRPKRRRDPRLSSSIFSWGTYLGIFVMVGGAVTSCSLLLLWNADVAIGPAFWVAALQNIGNVFFVSALFTLVYGIWRRRTVQRPVERILDFCRQVSAGDFSARVERRGSARPNELDVIAEDLNRMAAELAGVETLRTDFVASVSHEMKTPLAQVSNYATLLQDPSLSDTERAELARDCVRSARRLSDLVTNVLRLNKLENQEIFSAPTRFDLAEQLRECVLGFEQLWNDKGIELVADIPDELYVTADAELLPLVWNNLLSNALKYTDTGGKVRVSLAAGERDALTVTVTVTVTDTGCGMDASTTAHAFDRFYQGDTSHAAEGNGLGLALVRRACDVCGADVQLKSEPGVGTTATVMLASTNGEHAAVGRR